MKKKNTNEEKPQMKKYFVEEKITNEEKNTEVENIKEVTHENEFMFFSDLVLLQ